jgi:hypothetical protein
MSPLLSLKKLDKIDDLETEIEDRLREKSILQRIDYYSNNRIDFIDLFKPYELLIKHIEELQKELRRLKQNRSVHVFEEEEEEEGSSSSSSKYNIEHVIKDEEGKQRPLKPEDLDIEKHKGVRKAFKLIYEWHKDYKGSKEYEEEEEEEEKPSSFNIFNLKKQVYNLALLRKYIRDFEMTQGEIVSFLKKNKNKWFTANQLAAALRVAPSSVNRCLVRLRKHSEVKEKTQKVIFKSRHGLIKKGVSFYSSKRR